jgi:tRNA(Ser,Leu) C12 N-acetylase TAN1
MSGRIGRVFTQLRDYLDADVEIQPSAEYQKSMTERILTEGYFDVVKNTFNGFINKYKEISDVIKEKYRVLIDNFSKLTGGFIDKIKTNLFTKLNQEINVFEKNSFKELKNIEDNIQKEFESLNEKKSKMCGTTSAELTPSLIKNIQDYEKLLSATNTDTALIEKIIETSNNPSVTKYFKFEIDNKNLTQIKDLKNNVKSISKQIATSKQSCISREELSPILMYRSNILALQYIDLIMKKVLQDTNLSSPDKIQEEFLKLASVLSTEAIFGGNVSLPLIKYTGNKLERLGYKNEFKIKVPETIPDLKLGKLTVKLEPESNAYLVIYLYLFFGIETGDDKVTPTYVLYEMRSESGSSFTFKVEGNKIVNKI